MPEESIKGDPVSVVREIAPAPAAANDARALARSLAERLERRVQIKLPAIVSEVVDTAVRNGQSSPIRVELRVEEGRVVGQVDADLSCWATEPVGARDLLSKRVVNLLTEECLVEGSGSRTTFWFWVSERPPAGLDTG
jgi:hypothetical protein